MIYTTDKSIIANVAKGLLMHLDVDLFCSTDEDNDFLRYLRECGNFINKDKGRVSADGILEFADREDITSFVGAMLKFEDIENTSSAFDVESIDLCGIIIGELELEWECISNKMGSK